MNTLVVLIAASIAPFFLLPVEKLLPYPSLIEELVKYGIVIFLNRLTLNKRCLWVISAGLLFAFSETIIYTSDIFMANNPLLIVFRFLVTGFLHVSTLLLMDLFYRKSHIKFIGLIVAIIFHFAYNGLIQSLL